ncbi:MAG: hydantoinase B/oxoprolinase family protein [Candidatus Dormibacteraceae bacterium]
MMAVFANRFEGIGRSMMNTLVRTARSAVVNTARDCSCCLLTGNDELLVMAESLPIHVVRGPELMSKAMKHFHPQFKRGDAFLHNSPYHGNSHAADHSILVPVIDGEGVHRFTVLAKAHQADCGNAQPTTYSATARDLYEEGALIFPCVRIQEDYKDCQDIVQMCRLRMRVPEQWWGDYLALIGAARIGERKLIELGDEVGWEVLDDFATAWFDYSEERMIAEIRKLPSGHVTVEGAHDPFPGVPQGVPLKASVAIDRDSGTIEVDLRDNPDCQPCGLNLTEATALTAGMVGVFNSIDHSIPHNEGSFRRIHVSLRENCIAGIPVHPTSCSVATTNIADRIANLVQRAMAEFGEGIGMAEVGLGFPPSLGVISGLDPRRNDAPYVNQLILAWTCGAASPHADGWIQHGGVGDGGALMRDSIELDELRFPIYFRCQRIVPDSEGAGRTRGALAAVVEYGPLDGPMRIMYASDGTVNPSQGVRGGLAGSPARQYKRDRAGTITQADACGDLILQDGETVISVSCGGGGYGSPLEREITRVIHDVKEGWITPDRARAIYGVFIDDSGQVDIERSRAIRETTLGGPMPADT